MKKLAVLAAVVIALLLASGWAVWSRIESGRLADGTELAEDCGYVTNGMYGERAEFIIQPGGKLELKQGKYRASHSP